MQAGRKTLTGHCTQTSNNKPTEPLITLKGLDKEHKNYYDLKIKQS